MTGPARARHDFWLIMIMAAGAIVLAFAITARASSCHEIRDFDKRAARLAEERRSPDGCRSIERPLSPARR
jgi:hypothetical protein